MRQSLHNFQKAFFVSLRILPQEKIKLLPFENFCLAPHEFKKT